MKTVGEIYEEYHIMPQLQLHQLRVASVAKLLVENSEREVGGAEIITAALFHDMGNIIKADLQTFPEFVEPEGKAHWQKIKDEFVATYGTRAHDANVAIARRIPLPPRVVELIDGVSFGNIRHIAEGSDMDQKILEYADIRVGPHGVLSAKERLEEARRRYIDSGKTYYTPEGFDELAHFAFEIERQIFETYRIKPEDITDDAVAPFIEELRKRPVSIGADDRD